MQIMSNRKTRVSVGFKEKDSPLFGKLKPFISAAFAAAIIYVGAEDFGKTEQIQILSLFATAFGLESINVQRKSRQG